MTHLPDFLEGAVDPHVHSAPDIDRRRLNDLELARAAKEAGVGEVLIKSHQNFTVERPWLVARCVLRTMMQTNPELLLAASKPICQEL